MSITMTIGGLRLDWELIEDAYTPAASDASPRPKYLRVTATYTDRNGNNKDGADDVGQPGAGGGWRKRERVP